MAITWNFQHGETDGNALQASAMTAFYQSFGAAGPTFATASSFVMQDGPSKIVFDGSFEVTQIFPPSIAGGTITGFKVYGSDVLMFEASGYGLDFHSLMNGLAAAKANPQEFEDFFALLMPGPMHVNGTEDADVLGGGAFADVILAFGSSDIVGSAGGDDVVFGGDGNDHIRAGDGNDWVSGGSGLDSLYGGAGIDTADYSEKTEFVEVTLDGSTSANVLVGGVAEDTVYDIENLVGGLGNDVFRGDGHDNRFLGALGDDRLDGGPGNDALLGEAGADTLGGDAGSDEINGGLGRDVLSGGLDGDRFVFDTALGKKGGKANADVILDFATGFDRIVLDSDVFKRLDAGVLKSKFFAADDPGDGNDYVVFKGGKLYYDKDGDGDAAMKLVAKLSDHAKLHTDDILIV